MKSLFLMTCLFLSTASFASSQSLCVAEKEAKMLLWERLVVDLPVLTANFEEGKPIFICDGNQSRRQQCIPAQDLSYGINQLQWNQAKSRYETPIVFNWGCHWGNCDLVITVKCQNPGKPKIGIEVIYN